MMGVVIAAHGDLGQALIDSAELILGPQENVSAVSLAPQENLESCLCSLLEGINLLDTSQGVIVLADLFGGTPCNASALGVRQRDYPVVSGVNLPMLLEIFLNRDCVQSVDEMVEIALEAGHTGIVDVGAVLKARQSQAAAAAGAAGSAAGSAARSGI